MGFDIIRTGTWAIYGSTDWTTTILVSYPYALISFLTDDRNFIRSSHVYLRKRVGYPAVKNPSNYLGTLLLTRFNSDLGINK